MNDTRDVSRTLDQSVSDADMEILTALSEDEGVSKDTSGDVSFELSRDVSGVSRDIAIAASENVFRNMSIDKTTEDAFKDVLRDSSRNAETDVSMNLSAQFENISNEATEDDLIDDSDVGDVSSEVSRVVSRVVSNDFTRDFTVDVSREKDVSTWSEDISTRVVAEMWDVSRDVSRDVQRDVSSDSSYSSEMADPELKSHKCDKLQQTRQTAPVDYILSDDDTMSTDSDDSDIEYDIVTDDSMSDDDDVIVDDAVCEITTYDANNVVNDTFRADDNNALCHREKDDVSYRDSTTFYILNLTSNPETLGHDGISGGGMQDVLSENRALNEANCERNGEMNGEINGEIDSEKDIETVGRNEKTDQHPEEKTFRSRFARIKAFFSKKEKSLIQISTESDSGITTDFSDDQGEICVSSDAPADIINGSHDLCEDDDDNDNDDSDENSDDRNIPDDLSEGFFSLNDWEASLNDEVVLVAELQDTIHTLHREYLAWRRSRQNSVAEIYTMADSLDGHQRNVDIAKVTGTSVGAAATVAGIVFTSLALAPVTAGSSLFVGLGIGAGVVGGAGVGTGIGAVVTKKKLERGKWERLQQIVTEDQEVTDKLRMTIERYDHVLSSVTNLVKEKEELGTARTILSAVRGTHTLAEKITVSVLKDVIRSAAGVTTEAVDGGAKAALVAGRVLGGIGIALGGIALVIDIIYLVQVGRNIRSGSKCDVAKRLRNVAKILNEEMVKIDDVLAFDLAMTGSRSRSDISRSAIYDIHDLGEDDLEFDEMTFGKLHIDTSFINWSDDEILD